ncbi:hypothetical protein L228DRAFT_264501 [Xylona heveae TC161]|uniref:Cep57 centrosome microtubule-binding domain-containing protein n=1 Tax=Xylona heveae (strain CBS 132557 / TC161) TaxID=1328760 RepID=A0A165JCZ1_XYLHT|nr:hypothetical protein L228DRAFT_264501 [Xylona heveae TC161]KZF26070.1 hypothetical protein L228DRAFT_264501 [Xylona heveae TC161]
MSVPSSPSLASQPDDFQHQIRQIQEMSRDFSRASLSSGFSSNPEIEESSLFKLPNIRQLRASAEKYRPGARYSPDSSVFVDTSAMANAFPDFSGVFEHKSPSVRSVKTAASQPPSADLPSLELPRGNSNGQQQIRRMTPRIASVSDQNWVDTSSEAVTPDYKADSPPSPPNGNSYINRRTRPFQSSTKPQMAKNNLNKPSSSGSDKSSPPLHKLTDFGSNNSRPSSDGNGRQPSPTNDVDFDRPPTVTINGRNSRFGIGASRSRESTVNDLDKVRNKQVPLGTLDDTYLTNGTQFSLPPRPSNPEPATPRYLRGLGTTGTMTSASLSNTTTRNFTLKDGRSFVVPPAPEMSELVSGTFKNGTPVFARGSRAASRFSRPPGPGDHSLHVEELEDDGNMDERAIVLSLRLLQERVVELEHEKAQGEQKNVELKRKNSLLKTEIQELELDRQERATRDYDERLETLVSEKIELHKSVKTLEAKLDAADRKAAVAEISVKNLTNERDSAVQQLGVAYYNSVDLQNEVDALTSEKENWESAKIDELEKQVKNWETKTSTEIEELTNENRELRNKLENTSDLDHVTKENAAIRQALENYESEKVTWSRVKAELVGEIERLRHEVQAKEAALKHEQRARAVAQEVHASNKEERNVAQSKGDTTVLSFIEPDFIANLRMKLETERLLAKTGKSDENSVTRPQDNDLTGRFDVNIGDYPANASDDGATHATEASNGTNHVQSNTRRNPVDDVTANSFKSTGRNSTQRSSHSRASSYSGTIPNENEIQDSINLSRLNGENETAKSEIHSQEVSMTGDVEDSIKKIHKQLSHENLEQANKKNTLSKPARRYSDNSIPAGSKRRRGVEDVTSAFILPDITLATAPRDIETLSEAGHEACNGHAQHDAKNCTICTRVLTTDGEVKYTSTVKIPKPIPVSKRMPEPSKSYPDPTVRPAQSPAYSLATVIKMLEDELAHLRVKLQKYQAFYNAHDASMSKRQRKSIMKKIRILMETAELKADQIYNLYDVVETQASELDDLNLEETLNSIGLDVSVLSDVRPNDNSDASSSTGSESLPWEGLDE